MTESITPAVAEAVDFENLPLRLRLVAFFGHGRLLEMYLVTAKLLFAIFLIQPLEPIKAVALQDLIWIVPEPAVAAPFFCIGVIQGIGLVMNYRRINSSWIFRFVGAFFGAILWGWMIYKSIAIEAITTGLMPFAVASFLFSLLLMFLASHGLPMPGKYVIIRQP